MHALTSKLLMLSSAIGLASADSPMCSGRYDNEEKLQKQAKGITEIYLI